MPYQYLTLAQARAQLGNKLFDPSFWTVSELSQYIQESLRTWNAHTSLWRSEFVFQTVANTEWYDITSVANSNRPFTLRDVYIIQLVESILLEPTTVAYPLVWGGSLQFSLTDILYSIQRRRDEVLSITGCTITRSNPNAPIQIRNVLGDSVIDVRRLAWHPVAGQGYGNCPVWPSDSYGQQSFNPGFIPEGSGAPSSYRQSSEPPLSFDVNIIPAVPGTYDLLTVNAGSALSMSQSTLLGIPDDYAWVIAFGALADLLSRESNAKDDLRAKYCEARYRQGVALLFNSPALLYARINNLPASIDSVWNADNYRPGWQAEAPGQPDSIYTAGLNLIATARIPNNKYGVTLSTVQNAPVPTNDGDYLQVAKDDLEVVLDYAQHLATLKMGGDEFLSTMPLLQRFFKQAAIYNSKLSELGEFTDIMYSQSQLQAESSPVYTPETV